MNKTKTAPESIRSKKNASLHSTFHVGSEVNCVWIRIRDEKMVGSGSRIKHPGSATLNISYTKYSIIPVYYCVDANLMRIQRKLVEGTAMDTGDRGANKVSSSFNKAML
jgi:hypothetical protein